MKYLCPHCSENEVRGFSKFMSYEASPAVCDACRKFSCEPPGIRNYYNFMSAVGLPVALAVGIFAQFWWLVLAWVIFIAVFPFYALFALPLVPVHEVTVKKAKWQLYIWSILFLALIIWSGLDG